MTESSEPHADSKARTMQTRRRGKALQSGFTLLARGEPQIWFTGGMLILCLAMIFGLLGLILVSGLPTFWPRRLQVIALNDGSLEIGQPQKTQVRSESSRTEAESSSPAKERLPSRYYRTANADITGRHFRWIDPSEATDTGIGSPDWAMVVERLSWGRLYGIPLSLSEQIQLDSETFEQEKELARFIELLNALADEENNELRQQLLELLEAKKSQTRNEALRQRVKAIGEAENHRNDRIQLQSVDAQWKSVAQVAVDAVIHDARLLITDPPTLLSRLQSAIDRTTHLRSEVEELRVEISRLDARISKLRAGVRRAELETETPVALQVEQTHFFLEQLEEIKHRDTVLQSAVKRIEGEWIEDSETAAKAIQWLSGYRTQQLPMELATLEEQLQTWLEPIRSQPQPIIDAVEHYQNEYRKIVSEKRPLQRKLESLEVRLAVGDVTFAVPTGGQKIEGLSSESVSDLASGTLAEPVRQALKDLSIDAETIAARTLASELTLVTVTDTKGDRHLLALTRPGYVSSDPAPQNEVFLLPEKVHACHEIVRAVAVNQLTLSGKVNVYLDRWREFLTENPRENTEGGVFPAIWGTVVMTLIMTIAVVPFGVMAALYLREYTKAGPLVSLIRISINNLAGVPSIVYGVFGYSFFCLLIGAYIDGGPKNADIIPMPSIAWFILFGLTAAGGTTAFLLSFLGSGPSHTQTARKRWMSKAALFLWLVSIAAMAYLLLKSPFFDGFYREYLPSPTFGKGGLLWAALTLSLLTLPVVIVATEEALAAVPNSLREGSLACGASKWQTIYRIVLPHARPGILTGAILAMARGAGEVAPLMLVGALPSAPDLPLDGEFPFFHGSRSFMHLGYQIYTLGFQSPNSEAAKPMVFTCTLLLIAIVAALNVSAIYLRARLKRRFQGNAF